MALTRKMLAAMDIPAEKIDEIISAHAETVGAIKEERDALKADADKVAGLQKELEKANNELAELKAGDWQSKYEKVQAEYNSYKTDTETKAVKASKAEAYKQLLLDAGIADKRIASILKVTDVDGIKLDKDGKIEGADKLAENVKTEWADFIVTKQEQGAKTPNPPANEGDGGNSDQPSRAALMAAKYRNEHYGNLKEE